MPFPLPEASVDRVISLYGQFSDADLKAVVATNQCVLGEADPVHHLLALREQPYLQRFEEDVGEVKTAVGYRSAVCLGATMLRRYGEQAGLRLSELHVNPDRRYLFFSDAPADEAYRRYGSWPIMTEDFTDPKHYHRYFQDESSVRHLRNLQDTLVSNHIGFLEGMSRDQQTIDFGYFCRGLLDTFALYAQLRHEDGVAPPNQIYDAEIHQLLDGNIGQSMSGQSMTDVKYLDLKYPDKRWRVGGVKMLRPEGFDLKPHEQTGATAVPEYATLLSLHRGIAGYVRTSDRSDSPLLPVFFKESKEQFEFEWGDAIIMRNTRQANNGTTTGVFRAERAGCPPLVRHDALYPDAEVVALARNGQVKFLYDPPINLDTEESTLASAMLMAEQHPGYKTP